MAVIVNPKQLGATQTMVAYQASRIVELIHNSRLDLSDEKRTQADLAAMLTFHGFSFEREKRLAHRDIPDFLLPSGLVIELKLGGAGKMDVWRQLRRYAIHQEVAGLLLATNLSMGLPADIDGKPAWYASLGRGWL